METALRVYRGDVNNGVRTFYGEATLAALQRQLELAKQYGWDFAHAQIPFVGPIATFVNSPDHWDHASHAGYLTGTMQEFVLWAPPRRIQILESPVSNYVPFSNGELHKDVGYWLTDEQFRQMFGMERPQFALSRLDFRPPAPEEAPEELVEATTTNPRGRW